MYESNAHLLPPNRSAHFAELDPCLRALLRFHLVWTSIFRPYRLQVVS